MCKKQVNRRQKKEKPHGLLRSFLIGKTPFVHVVNSPWIRKIYDFPREKPRMNSPRGASFSLGSYRGYSLIYVYIHFQYFPTEKLIVHVNGYSFRLSTKVCKENHSSQKREYPLTSINFEPKFSSNADPAGKISPNQP